MNEKGWIDCPDTPLHTNRRRKAVQEYPSLFHWGTCPILSSPSSAIPKELPGCCPASRWPHAGPWGWHRRWQRGFGELHGWALLWPCPAMPRFPQLEMILPACLEQKKGAVCLRWGNKRWKFPWASSKLHNEEDKYAFSHPVT